MKFVDRIEEQKRLKEVFNSEKSTFTVIYGRRRLGKSTLVTKVLGSRDVYYLADQTEARLQRENLSKMIAHTIPNFDKKHLLVGECKWTNGENVEQLLAELRAKAERLPFAKGHKIVIKLFLKTAADGSSDDVYLPEDVINMI